MLNTSREKSNNNFIDSIFDDYYTNKKKIIKIYSSELEHYTLIDNVKELYKLPLGGYIRYINSDNEIRWGGALIKITLEKKDNITYNYIHILDSHKNITKVCFEKNIMFYRNHRTSNDKLKDIFISYI
jgi:hypothetical protein